MTAARRQTLGTRRASFLLCALVLAACSGDEAAGEATDAIGDDVTLVDTRGDAADDDVRVDAVGDSSRDALDVADSADALEAEDTAVDAADDSSLEAASDSDDTFDGGTDVADSPAPTCEGGTFASCDGATTGCPACEAGTICVYGGCVGGSAFAFCAPVPDECDGAPTCGCMGCACPMDQGPCLTVNDVGLSCRGTTSRRDRKRDIHYLDDVERARLAEQVTSTPLATYAYKTDPANARRRLGFIIDDQPDPSFAVDDDRTHVDLYGYTSMLLATIQQQQEELDELTRRVEALEKR